MMVLGNMEMVDKATCHKSNKQGHSKNYVWTNYVNIT